MLNQSLLKSSVMFVLCVTGLLLALNPVTAQEEALNIEDRRELFVDSYLIDSLEGVTQQLARVRDDGVAIEFDQPWEGLFCGYATVLTGEFGDGYQYRCYYRGNPKAGKDGDIDECYCVALSKDGITWIKPKLGLYESDGTKETNIILGNHAPETHNFCPMLDTREGVPADQKFKALGGTRSGGGLVPFVSADGFSWKELQKDPVITQGAFDSQNVPMWSEHEQKYVCYLRVFVNGIRRISRCESDDFIHWTEPKLMDYGGKPIEHLYTNQTSPYFRAPHIYVAIAARFFPGRRVLNKEQAAEVGVHPKYFNDCSDGIFMTTRGGYSYDRTFMEGFIRPGIGMENWVSRTNYPALNVVPIDDKTMSVYANQNYGQPTSHLRRYTMRIDGFASLRAEYEGGSAVTKPFTFKGDKLTANFATSAAGEIHVEIQDADGKPIPGFTLKDSVPAIGNEISRTIRWKNGTDVSVLQGKTIRLHFKMKDADLYAIKFSLAEK